MCLYNSLKVCCLNGSREDKGCLSAVEKCLWSSSLNNHDVSAVMKRISPGVGMLARVLLIPK